MKIVLSITVVIAALVLFTVLGACGAFALDLWDRARARREERRQRREQLRAIDRR